MAIIEDYASIRDRLHELSRKNIVERVEGSLRSAEVQEALTKGLGGIGQFIEPEPLAGWPCSKYPHQLCSALVCLQGCLGVAP